MFSHSKDIVCHSGYVCGQGQHGYDLFEGCACSQSQPSAKGREGSFLAAGEQVGENFPERGPEQGSLGGSVPGSHLQAFVLSAHESRTCWSGPVQTLAGLLAGSLHARSFVALTKILNSPSHSLGKYLAIPGSDSKKDPWKEGGGNFRECRNAPHPWGTHCLLTCLCAYMPLCSERLVGMGEGWQASQPS